jgi:hypothetical protein
MLTSGYSPAKMAVAKIVEISRVRIFFMINGWVDLHFKLLKRAVSRMKPNFERRF